MIPNPSDDEVVRAWVSLSVLAGLPDPPLTQGGSESSRQVLTVPWLEGVRSGSFCLREGRLPLLGVGVAPPEIRPQGPFRRRPPAPAGVRAVGGALGSMARSALRWQASSWVSCVAWWVGRGPSWRSVLLVRVLLLGSLPHFHGCPAGCGGPVGHLPSFSESAVRIVAWVPSLSWVGSGDLVRVSRPFGLLLAWIGSSSVPLQPGCPGRFSGDPLHGSPACSHYGSLGIPDVRSGGGCPTLGRRGLLPEDSRRLACSAFVVVGGFGEVGVISPSLRGLGILGFLFPSLF